MNDIHRDINDEYRDAARQMLAAVPDVSVDPYAHVQLMKDGGAFVEVHVFVPAAFVEMERRNV